MKKAFMNWSGGKDAAYALYVVQQGSVYKGGPFDSKGNYSISQDNPLEIDSLITTVGEHGRVSLHGVGIELLEAQALAVGLPLCQIETPLSCSMEEYGSIMRRELSSLVDQGYTHSVFGDIALEDLKEYREQTLGEIGLQGVFPLWNRNTQVQAEAFIDAGFRSVVVSVNGNLMDSNFVGREFDKSFLRDLPDGVDPCGENGEFHSFVYDGPIFSHPLHYQLGDVIERAYPATSKSPNGSIFYFRDIQLG